MFPYTDVSALLLVSEQTAAELRADAARYRLARQLRPAPSRRLARWRRWSSRRAAGEVPAAIRAHP